MQFLLNRNYLKVICNATAHDERVSVAVTEGEDFENFAWGGTVVVCDAMDKVDSGLGLMSIFFASPGYRYDHYDSWSFCPDGMTVAAYVCGDKAYAIIDANNEPFLVRKDSVQFFKLRAVRNNNVVVFNGR